MHHLGMKEAEPDIEEVKKDILPAMTSLELNEAKQLAEQLQQCTDMIRAIDQNLNEP